MNGVKASCWRCFSWMRASNTLVPPSVQNRCVRANGDVAPPTPAKHKRVTWAQCSPRVRINSVNFVSLKPFAADSKIDHNQLHQRCCQLGKLMWFPSKFQTQMKRFRGNAQTASFFARSSAWPLVSALHFWWESQVKSVGERVSTSWNKRRQQLLSAFIV